MIVTIIGCSNNDKPKKLILEKDSRPYYFCVPPKVLVFPLKKYICFC